MGEWLKPAVLKTVSGETRSGVRIPLPPFYKYFMFNYLTYFSRCRECETSNGRNGGRSLIRRYKARCRVIRG
jgi:hypothetical protein